MIRRLGFVIFLAIIALCLEPQRSTSAHPLDQLTQQLLVELRPTRVDISFAISGGLLANELVLTHLDPDGDQLISPVEQSAWMQRWLRTFRISLDGDIVPIEETELSISLPSSNDFYVGLSPIVINLSIPLPPIGPVAEHRLSVTSNYLIDRSVFRLEVIGGIGTEIVDESWPASTMKIAFRADPAFAAAGDSPAADASHAWGSNGVLAKAQDVFEHERTPTFMVFMTGIFMLMGALHAIQPGHGKTLVAAYLVATGGTSRDALTLAAIVTFTHTISVFALGLATLAASELFLPSKVIPVMGAISGLLVASMGIAMLRGFILRRRGTMAEVRSADYPHVHGHSHDHAQLSDEDHARLHLEQALHRSHGVERRGLITLGVSGGLAPCPDALAILLLAIGMGQAGLGMLAIVAFSAGLAIVLVMFGLAISLARPFWSRLKERKANDSVASRALGRFAGAAPVFSAAIILILGLGMAWRSIQLG